MKRFFHVQLSPVLLRSLNSLPPCPVLTMFCSKLQALIIFNYLFIIPFSVFLHVLKHSTTLCIHSDNLGMLINRLFTAHTFVGPSPLCTIICVTVVAGSCMEYSTIPGLDNS